MSQSMQQTMWCKATLQYPTVGQLPLESVGDMLSKAANLATTANFQWSYIDKPPDGSIFLVYIQNGTPTPPDGFMYMGAEQPYTANVGGKYIEILDHKYGFLPGQEQVTTRSRRRFRLSGKNPNDVAASLWILFYSRTGDDMRVAANPMQARPQPMRKYPLPNVTTKPFNLFQAMTGAAQMPSHQHQMQQQYQLQQMQQLQAQQAQVQAQAAAAATLQAQQGQQLQDPARQMPPQRLASTPLSQTHVNQYAAPMQLLPSKRSYQGHTPLVASQHLPPEAVARMQRGEVLAEGAVPFDEFQGDALDALHPIDISRARFVRHQDWMEEIFSVYPASRIVGDTIESSDINEQTLTAQIEHMEQDVKVMQTKQDALLESIKSPGGVQGRIKHGLEKLATAGDDLDEAALHSLESEVGMNVVPWQRVRTVPLHL